MSRSRSGLRLLLASVLWVTACGEPRVVETLRCTLHGDGSSEVAFAVELPSQPPAEADQAYADQLAEVRQLYMQGWDPWARRFEEAGAVRETLHWERLDGELRGLTRTAGFEEPAALSAFFADTDVTVQFDANRAESSFAIFPGSPSRATGEQRERLEDLLESWSAAVVRYLQEVSDLYLYLDREPDRAEPIFRAIFGDDGPNLDAVDEERLDRLVETFLEVMAVADRSEGETDSLEQLARLVYDPFPAELSVSIEGEVLEFRGFVPSADGSFAVPPLGLEHALVRLEEAWVQPPLLTTYERLERLEEDAEPAIQAFARSSRTVAPSPTAKEISATLEVALAPEPEYRLRWRPTREPESGDQ